MNLKSILFATAFATLPLGAQAGLFCVINGAEQDYFFTVDSGDGRREGKRLGPAGALCMAGTDAGGVVSVFESEEALEGCSRLVVNGQMEVMLAYSEFDRCRWSSNDG